MRIRAVRRLLGPNGWATCPVIDACLDLGAAGDLPVESVRGLLRTLGTVLPTWSTRHEAHWVDILRDESEATVHPLARLTVELAGVLQGMARADLGYGRALPTCETGVCRIALGAYDDKLAEECLASAVRILNGLFEECVPDLSAERQRLVDFADEVCIGPSTMVIVDAAKARGIPYRRLGELSLIQFGHGCRQRRIWTAETDSTGAIAEGISRDKHLTKMLLKAAGVPVPHGRIVHGADDAWMAAGEVGVPVVVKPLDGNHGRGVFTNLKTRDEVLAAYPLAAVEGTAVIVEKFAPGVEHRMLVVGDRMVACVRGEYAYVTGDGGRTIAQLIEEQLNRDVRRSSGENCPNDLIEIDAIVLAQLAQEGYTPESVPAAAVEVLVKRMGTHGPDVTASVHPEVARQAVIAAQAIGLDIAGIDIVVEDVSQPLEQQGGIVCEVNAGPQLLVHVRPAEGPGQPVGEAIVELLFPQPSDGRIPLYLILGSRPGDGTAILVDELLRRLGRKTACVGPRGLRVSGRQTDQQEPATPRAARDVLLGTQIDTAVWDLNWKNLAREGFPAERIDVVALLSATDLELVEPTDLAEVESYDAVVSAAGNCLGPRGTVVINAADRQLLDRVSAVTQPVVMYNSDAHCPALQSHAHTGGRTVTVEEGQLVASTGQERIPLAAWPLVHPRPVSSAGSASAITQLAMVEEWLAALSILWGAGFSPGELSRVISGTA